MQVFDSWVGALNARDYREFILPHTRRIFDALARYDVPTIHFGVGTGAILGELREAGGDVIGADWRTPLDEAWERIGFDRGDPGQPRSDAAARPARSRRSAAADDVLARAAGRAGHIFNLGHGILPSTPVEHVQALARYVHQQTRAMIVITVPVRRLGDHCDASTANGRPTGASTGVLLMAHGTPRPLDEMPEYLRLVRGGRPPSAELVDEMRAQLRGDRRTLAADRPHAGAGRGAAARLGAGVPVAVGMRNWTPFIKDALAELAAAGVTRVIGIPLAPQFSTLSVGKYFDAATRGAARRRRARSRSTRFTCIRCSSRPSPSAFARRRPGADEDVVFTAHSLPVRVIESGDPLRRPRWRRRRRRSPRAPASAATSSPTRAPAGRRSPGSVRTWAS